ncbi:HNH endonuclease [Hydrogenophaga aromaticivorans]|uniref:HNH endonuclease n=1 Tax=Hydrogenophaga aromaticivorans TaxID=2610898 RepID=UPI001B392CFC|nr:HNH endonuclease [Hydrogenophaga aromaticivorans]MBQ0917482.1 HNH endonuclease [Hydrogenophaga aromaticivorans]
MTLPYVRLIVRAVDGEIDGVDRNGGFKKSVGFKRGNYRAFLLYGVHVLVSRFIYAHVHGPVPPWLQVDHINQNKLDNRIENLRLVTCKQNNENRFGPQANNSIGLRGVCKASMSSGYRAQIKHNKKKIHLGTFETAEEAHAAYRKAAAALHTHNPNI